MNIDFHTHGKLTKKMPFSIAYTDWLFKQAKQAGLDAICLTEHFNTLGFEELYNYIKKNYEKEGDTFLVDGLRLFAGMETDVREGGHILSIGKMEDILEINHRLIPYKEKGQFISFEKLMELFKAYYVIVGCAHPFRAGGHVPKLPLEQLKNLDFVDLNGKDLARAKEETILKTYEFAKALEISVVSGSDTHQAFQYGCVQSSFKANCTTIEDLWTQMQKGEYTIEINESLPMQVKAATMLKKALKEIHALGGDYLSTLLEGAAM